MTLVGASTTGAPHKGGVIEYRLSASLTNPQAGPKEIVPVTAVVLSALPDEQEVPRLAGTSRLTTDVPANEPVTFVPKTLVFGIPLLRNALTRQLIVAESGAFVGDDEEHTKGAEANDPLSFVVWKANTIPLLVVHPESVATKADFLVPPPRDTVSGGENLTFPEKEQRTQLANAELLVLPVLAEAIVDDTTTTPIDTSEPTTHHTIALRTCVTAR